MPLTSRQRQQILRVVTAAIGAANPRDAVRGYMRCAGGTLHIGERAYNLDDTDRILVVGGGKAGAPMAAVVGEMLGPRITAGAINVKYGHAAAATDWTARFAGQDQVLPAPAPDQVQSLGAIAITEAGHPAPDASGLAGAARSAALLGGLTSRDLVLVLLSGGGSALLPLPVPGITLDDYRALNAQLLRCGAAIGEINAVRKHCSQLQGGQLARLAAPAQVAALILSDVVGSPLDVIASGPTIPDPSTFADAVAVLARYGILGKVPAAVCDHLLRGVAGLIPDTPKPGDPLFERVHNAIIGDNLSAARGACREASRWELQPVLLTTCVQGEAREVARVVAGLALGIARDQSDLRAPVCLVLGGETTVTVRGTGLGGRNQELALAAAIALDGQPLPPGVEVAIVSVGTDGTDGPTDAAGGLATPATVERGRVLGLDAEAALADNDSYHYLAALGDLLVTGPTQTNVNDLILVFVFRS